MIKKVIVASWIPLLLSGCVMSSTMFGNGVTTQSLLGVEGNELRTSFLVARIAGNPQSYRVPIECKYRFKYARNAVDRIQSGSGRITLNSHKNAIFSYVELDRQESTASMDSSGFVKQFNATQLDGGQILGWQRAETEATPANFESAAVPEILMLLPHYNPGPWSYGDAVASVYNLRRQPVGEYIYRGMVTDYSEISREPGKRYAALDLLSGFNGQPFDRQTTQVIRGFAIVDLDTMLPVTFSYRTAAGGELILRNRNCR